jgi:hypothetical protein
VKKFVSLMAVVLVFNRRVLHKASQQSVQWTVAILRHFRAFSTPEQNLGLGVLSTPAPPPLTQTVGWLRSKHKVLL